MAASRAQTDRLTYDSLTLNITLLEGRTGGYVHTSDFSERPASRQHSQPTYNILPRCIYRVLYPTALSPSSLHVQPAALYPLFPSPDHVATDRAAYSGVHVRTFHRRAGDLTDIYPSRAFSFCWACNFIYLILHSHRPVRSLSTLRSLLARCVAVTPASYIHLTACGSDARLPSWSR